MESGIPTDVILDLKSRWPNIYSVKMGKSYFIFRLLSRKEFGVVIDLQNYKTGSEEDYIFETCVLYPKISSEDLNNMLAGIVPEIVKVIVKMSGFSSSDSLVFCIEASRTMMTLADNQMTVVICKAFPHLTPEDVNNFDIQKLTYYLALAEQILGVTLEIPNSKTKAKHRSTPGCFDFEQDNREMFKSEVGLSAPPKNPSVEKLKRGKVG